VPHAVLKLALISVDEPIAVLFTVEPAARISVVISCHQSAIALSLIQLEEAFVSPAIRPIVDTEATCLAVDPFARELAAVGPLVDSKSINLVVDPGAFIRGTVGPLVDAVAILLTV